MTTDICPVRIGVGGYDIHIGEGLLEQAGAMLAPRLARPFTVIVTDRHVDRAQGDRLEQGLAAAGVDFRKVVLEPGEHAKSLRSLEGLLEELIDFGVERRDMILAFGGGVVGDLTGFAAAILRRGCRFAQIPTTLLAQVDSAVGGKTAVNSAKGKNLIGAFHQPAIVIADITALTTLPGRELKAGYAEIVKYGALGDEPFFAWLEKRGGDLLAGDAAARRVAVKRSCESKAEIVGADERETGVRALLNLGHTFGHALEASLGYSDRLLHGEAVAAGMALAFDFSVYRRNCPPADAARLKAHLAAVGLPAGLKDISGAPQFSADELLARMMQDKKVEGGALTLILLRRLGEAFIEKDVDAATILEFLKSAGAR
ncbi:MAG: 3-dehydroquinate synthase [Alphaproteobacteria bacterium RIFCSPHIGHO2_12_FULL_63_12]|nr:MAG: 3-dehydroquinate synthase [Alphaproteobacteria bacterium RIFCSPHIGHO2_12_FULL_63_12]